MGDSYFKIRALPWLLCSSSSAHHSLMGPVSTFPKPCDVEDFMELQGNRVLIPARAPENSCGSRIGDRTGVLGAALGQGERAAGRDPLQRDIARGRLGRVGALEQPHTCKDSLGAAQEHLVCLRGCSMLQGACLCRQSWRWNRNDRTTECHAGGPSRSVWRCLQQLAVVVEAVPVEQDGLGHVDPVPAAALVSLLFRVERPAHWRTKFTVSPLISQFV